MGAAALATPATDVQPAPRTLRALVGGLAPSFTRYCAVGASGYVVNAAVFWVAATWMPYLAAFALAFTVAATSNFRLNRRFTFSASSHPRASIQFGRFLTVSVAALASGVVVVALLVESAGLPEFLSALAAIGCTTPVSFGANRLWTFSHR
jgi:putative flippase GtrA